METVFYLGASTPRGFVSHYDSLFQELKLLTIIKGGPGCGKSTFMRAIAKAARERGLDVSLILCSSDPDSLDGILLPELSVGFVDGTAPHALEPKLCGGSMNYLNFGEFYDRAAMRPNEEEIFAVQQEHMLCYAHVTACMAAADKLWDSVRVMTDRLQYNEEMSAIAECLALSVLQPTGQEPKEVSRFLSAVTPKGLHFCTGTPGALCEKVYVLRDNYGLAPRLLTILLKKAAELGHSSVLCYSPLLPTGAPTHLLIPSAGAAFVSESRNFLFTEPSFCKIDLDSTIPQKDRKELEFCQKTVGDLLYRSVKHMRDAKRLHDRMEDLSRPFVDFSAVDEMTKQQIALLFGSR